MIEIQNSLAIQGDAHNGWMRGLELPQDLGLSGLVFLFLSDTVASTPFLLQPLATNDVHLRYLEHHKGWQFHCWFPPLSTSFPGFFTQSGKVPPSFLRKCVVIPLVKAWVGRACYLCQGYGYGMICLMLPHPGYWSWPFPFFLGDSCWLTDHARCFAKPNELHG